MKTCSLFRSVFLSGVRLSDVNNTCKEGTGVGNWKKCSLNRFVSLSGVRLSNIDCILDKCTKKYWKFTEAFLRTRYFPDVTQAAFLLTPTNCVILDRIFRTCFHPEFGFYCAKYAYSIVELGKLYATDILVLKFVPFYFWFVAELSSPRPFP